jgi:serine/threonine-protein kinase
LKLGGKYRLICELGRGGMAVVYLAVALGASNFRKLAVVKLILPEFAREPGMLEMFFDEARLSARLNHPNIVQTYDVGMSEGRHFMAMEYLEGAPLSAIVPAVKPLFVVQAKVLLEVLEGLSYAHELRDFDGAPLHIVHRDISPHNVFVTYTGHVKILDFGIAKAATSSVRTATGVIKGKLKYMAPEQASGSAIDHRADLFSVGVMLWEAMTGQRRFPNDFSDVAAFSRVSAGAMPETPDATALGYSPAFNDILKRALAPDPAERYPTADAFHADLEAAIRAMPPCSLKELGAEAAVTFTPERLQVGAVVEKYLRMFVPEAASIAPGAAKADEVPTVRPPRQAGSSLDRESSLPALGPLPRDLMLEESTGLGLPHNGLTQHSLVARSVPHVKAGPSINTRVLAAVGALGLVIAFVGAWRMPGPAARTVGASGEGAAGAPRAEPRVQSVPVSPSLEPESAVPAVEPRGAPVETRATAPDESALAPAAPSRAPQTRTRKGAPSPAPTADATASPASSTTAAPTVPKPTLDRPVGPRASPPKVQLERDNPWHE